MSSTLLRRGKKSRSRRAIVDAAGCRLRFRVPRDPGFPCGVGGKSKTAIRTETLDVRDEGHGPRNAEGRPRSRLRAGTGGRASGLSSREAVPYLSPGRDLLSTTEFRPGGADAPPRRGTRPGL